MEYTVLTPDKTPFPLTSRRLSCSLASDLFLGSPMSPLSANGTESFRTQPRIPDGDGGVEAAPVHSSSSCKEFGETFYKYSFERKKRLRIIQLPVSSGWRLYPRSHALLNRLYIPFASSPRRGNSLESFHFRNFKKMWENLSSAVLHLTSSRALVDSHVNCRASES